MASTTATMTMEEFLALPDDGTERMLIRGELWEKAVATRAYPHFRAGARLTYLLLAWLLSRPEPRGDLVVGAARVRIRRDPDTIVGVDLAYISPELAAQTPPDANLIDGLPNLVIEFLFPSDRQGEIWGKVNANLDAGVPLVWAVEPVFRTITVYRPGAPTRIYNVGNEIDAEPHLPGFRVPVARIFAR